MTALGSMEIGVRQAALRDGPWAKEASLARQQLAPLMAPKVIVGLWQETPELLEKTMGDQDYMFRTAMTPHWIREPSSKDIELRDSLDQALTGLELLELAVQSGYLPLQAVAEEARNDLAVLLWSPATRSYVQAYDYDLVCFLADRVGLPLREKGLEHLPIEREDEDIRFADFLDLYSDLYENKAVREWQYRLDDYTRGSETHEAYWDFLKNGSKAKAQSYLLELHQLRTLGMVQFLIGYAQFFETLNPDVWPMYGSAISYWLETFFGFDRNNNGRLEYDEDFDWSDPAYLLGKGVFQIGGGDWSSQEQASDELRGLLTRSVDVLRGVLRKLRP